MPRQPLSLHQKLCDARKNIQHILRKYESIDFLFRKKDPFFIHFFISNVHLTIYIYIYETQFKKYLVK